MARFWSRRDDNDRILPTPDRKAELPPLELLPGEQRAALVIVRAGVLRACGAYTSVVEVEFDVGLVARSMVTARPVEMIDMTAGTYQRGPRAGAQYERALGVR